MSIERRSYTDLLGWGGVKKKNNFFLCGPGGRGCCRTPWVSPSASTCSRLSDCPLLRYSNVNMSSSESLKWRFLPSRLRQACTLLLTVLFVYDVFFVFITPFFTKVALQMPPRCRLSAVGHVMRNERLSLRRAARALWWRWRQALPTQPRTKR